MEGKRYISLFLVFIFLLGCLICHTIAQASDFIITVDDYSRIYYAMSNGDGTFSGYKLLDYLGGYYSRGVTINDFDNDGDMDFIAGRGISSTAYFYLFLNGGSDTFIKYAMVGTLSNANSYAMDMSSGDFDNDGNMDFIANGNQATTGVYLGDGAGHFSKTELNLGNYGRGMDVADFNNDGNLDFARANHSNGYTYVYPGNGNGTFGAAIYVSDTGDDPYGLAAGDFDNDGNADIIVNSGSGGDPYFFKGNGNNTFVAGVYVASLDFNNHGAYDGFDFNGDGDLDIIAVNYAGRTVKYYPGNGDGTFGAVVNLGTTSYDCMGVSATPICPPAGIPSAHITPKTQTIIEGGSAGFDGSLSSDSDGSLASWVWDFGDGNTEPGTGTNVGATTHTYVDEGIYNVTLLVTDDAGKKDLDTAIVIVEGDLPTVDTTPMTFGEALADEGMWDIILDGSTFASDTEGIDSYTWAIDDGFTEDFEDGAADGWDGFAGVWPIEGASPITGLYSYRQTNTTLDRTWNLFDKVYDTDITIEADVKLVSGSGEEAHIIFRAMNHQNNYEYILRGRGYDDILLYKRVNGSTTSLLEYDLTPAGYPANYVDVGKTFHVKIVCTGPWIEFHLDGDYLFAWYDTTFSKGKAGFSTYDTNAIFDNLTVTPSIAGQNAHHVFTAGVYNVGLGVMDAGGQAVAGIIPMTMQPGAAPIADAGGPYAADESAASAGGWTFTLDGTGSSDDVGIRKYVWDLGLDTFDSTVLQSGKWYTNGGISQNNQVSLTGANTWDPPQQRYMVTKALFPKAKGQVFQARVMTTTSGHCMFGFKNQSTTNFHYNQFPYEFYLTNGSIYIYENTNSRGDTGYDYSYNTWYDFRIELKDAGAVYSYRPSGTTIWNEVYNSSYTTADTTLRKGIVFHSGTWNMDDFSETTAGATSDFTLYRGTGIFNVDLTVYDRAGQSDTDSTTITITDGDAPVSYAGPDQSKDETDAVSGTWTVNFDATGSTDDFGIYTYEWDWAYDGTFDPSGNTGISASHNWSAPGFYTVAVRVTDHALQGTVDTLTVEITQGATPVADADGPYSVDEFSGNAFEGGWTVTLDGSGSSDAETAIDKYVWDLGTDIFAGTVINAGKWVYSSAGVSQNDAITITGASSWGQRYLFSKDTCTRAKGMSFEARLKHSSGSGPMIGFKNINTTYNYNQMPYAIYFTSGNLKVYEYGADRGDTGFDYSFNTWYEVRIELKETQGARYYYRLSGSPDWILIYDSNNGTDTSFKRGVDHYAGTLTLDDVRELAAGVTPSWRFYGLGSRSITLTVWDQAYQTDTDSTLVTIQANDPPVPDAGGNKSGDETDAFENTWTIDFDASGSTDDHGIYTYEWDWAYNGSFDPSGDRGLTATHIFTGAGVYTIALRVTDHALQSAIDTATVTLTNGDPPVAEAGPDITTEGIWPVIFNGGNSTDDFGIYRYDWNFGDGKTGTGKTPTHIYWTPGDYTVTLTVYDNILQSDSDTMTVHVLPNADPPVADAGGPYTAGAGGPPAYFNGSSSTDDYGIVKYLWDINDTVDSDGDGDFDNDINVVGRKPFYTYASTGTYTITLTVVDGAGQMASDTATVNVASNLAPDVICVPWRAGDPTIHHETYNVRSIRLKAIVRDAGSLTYQWNFGDGTALYPTTPGAVSNKYAIEASHTYPNSPDGTPYIATLTVWDSAGFAGTDSYYVMVQPDNLDTRTNIAIDEGLWWLHKNQDKGNGRWTSYSTSTYFASATSSAVQSFEINGHLQDGDNQENPYVETVDRGLAYIFTQLASGAIGNQTYGNPDTNGNGIGVQVTGDRPIYEGGMVMDAIASSNAPLAFTTTGGTNIKGRYYHEILTDMVDMYAWGQYDHATIGGGWRYSWNSGPDNSACQWAAIGMLGAEDNFGINVPQWVKDRNNVWLNYSYDGKGFGYTGSGYGVATTPSGMVQLAFCDKRTDDPRWRTAEDYIANNWFWQNNNYYAVYALVKSMRLALPYPVINLSATGLDWYNDTTTGVRKRLTDEQVKTSTYWGSWASGGYGGRNLDTAWAVIMLTPTLFVQPPVADAGGDIIWAYDMPLSFDASGSFHMDPARHIVKYEWDFDGDGIWDFTTADPADPAATFTYPDPDPLNQGDPPTVFIAKLRVTDDNEPAQTDIDTREVTVAEPPHAPFAMHGGPYTVTAGIPFTLDGSGSYDIDEVAGDGISRYQWDLDNDGVWFDDVDIDTTDATEPWTYAAAGVYTIGLKVLDYGVFNPIDCVIGDPINPCIPMDSIPVYTTVIVFANIAPVADAGGPYVVDEGTPVNLDGSGSYDANGDALSYLWDLDNDGEYDDASDVSPTTTFDGNGTYTIGLKVSDTLLDDTDSTTVTVNDLSPAAEFLWAPEPQFEGVTVSFFDISVSAPDGIVQWDWDFAGLGTSIDANPCFTFDDNGSYAVTLMVTDDDGSQGLATHTVTIMDKGPDAALTGDSPIDEGATGNYDASGSTSSPDAIASYEWDWDYDGTFDPSVDTGENQTHTWMDDGAYTIAVRVTDDDGSMDIATMTVTVNDLGPTAGFDWAPEPQNEGSAVVFTDTSASSPDTIIGWSWDFGGIGVSTDQNPIFTFMDNGVYTVTLTVTDDDGSTDVISHNVTVLDLGPTALLTGPTPLDEDQTGNYDASGSTSNPDTIVIYEWDWEYNGVAFDSSGDTGAIQSHAWPSAGTYTVAVRVTDEDGSTDIATLVVTVNPTQTITDLSARAKRGKVQLTWSPVPGADCYNIYRKTSIGSYTKISNCHVTTYCTYLDINVVNGTTYYYVVRSVTGGNESSDSNEVSITP